MSGKTVNSAVTLLKPSARARVALTCAIRALRALEAHPDVAAAVRDALAPALAWTDGQPVAPRQMYDGIPRLFACEPAVQGEPAAKSALFAALAALYFVTWCANRAKPDPLPNDVADVDDGYLVDAMHFAASAAADQAAEAAWQARLVDDQVRSAD